MVEKPKIKPHWDSEENIRWWIYYCPNCNLLLRVRKEFSPFYSDEVKECKVCGQEIYWN